MEKLEEFIHVIEKLTDTLNQMAVVETAKAQAAASNQPRLLDGYIREEQAAILKIRGLEHHRMELAEILGWKDMTFRQILAGASPDGRSLLEPLFHRLEESLSSLTRARDNSDRMIKVRLHELETAAAQAAPGAHAAEWRI